MQVLKWKLRHESVHAAQLVVHHPHAVDRVVAVVGKAVLDTAILHLEPQLGGPAAITGQDVAQVRASLSSFLRLFLKALELGQPPGDLQVGSSLAAVAGRMGQGKVVLAIQSVFQKRVDVVNVELPAVEYKVNRAVADETAAILALAEPVLKLVSLFPAQCGQVARFTHLDSLSMPRDAQRSAQCCFSVCFSGFYQIIP